MSSQYQKPDNMKTGDKMSTENPDLTVNSADENNPLRERLAGNRFPILVLDKNWYNIFEKIEKTPDIVELEQQLNKLLKDRSRLSSEEKDYKRVKKENVARIMELTEKAFGNDDSLAKKEMEKSQQIIQDINNRLTEYETTLVEIEDNIRDTNNLLLEACVRDSYDKMHDLKDKISLIDKQILEIRALLKKRLRQREIVNENYKSILDYLQKSVGDEIIRILDGEKGK